MTDRAQARLDEHTPGPWTIGTGRYSMGYSAIGGYIEDADGQPFISIKADEHAAANARLIAKAPLIPDLLAALLHAREVVEEQCLDVLEGPEHTPVCIEVTAAIKKARGAA